MAPLPGRPLRVVAETKDRPIPGLRRKVKDSLRLASKKPPDIMAEQTAGCGIRPGWTGQPIVATIRRGV